jgi:hypothetical protein
MNVLQVQHCRWEPPDQSDTRELVAPGKACFVDIDIGKAVRLLIDLQIDVVLPKPLISFSLQP